MYNMLMYNKYVLCRSRRLLRLVRKIFMQVALQVYKGLYMYFLRKTVLHQIVCSQEQYSIEQTIMFSKQY